MTSANRQIEVVVLLAGLIAPSIADGSPRSRAEALHEIQRLVQQGNVAAAEKQLAEALQTFPGDAAFYDLRGVVQAQKGNQHGAESDFLKAIEMDARLTGAYLNLGRLYQQNPALDPNAPRKALAVYGKLLGFDPNNVEANYQSAVLLEGRKAFQASLNHLSRLPAEDQERAQVLSVRCADLAGLGERAPTSATVDRLLGSPDMTEADLLTVLPALGAHRWDDLEERLLEGAARRQVAGFDLLTRLGRLYERKGKLQEARATLENAAQAQPRSVDTLVELARVADRQKDFKGALGYLAHARDLDSKNPAIHFFFGLVSVEENLLEEAYKSLRQAVILAPDNADFNYAVGSVAQQRANPREAIPYFTKYYELRPRDPRGPLALGITYFYAHDDDLARKQLLGVARYRETAAFAHFFLGRIANQEGKNTEALHELQEALAAQPNYADPYAEEGVIYMKQKDYVAAEKALRQALAIDPNHYVANLHLMMLYQRTGDPRAGEQAQRFEEVKKKRAEKEILSLRSIQIVR